MVAVTTLSWLLGGVNAAKSTCLGALVGFLPNVYFSFKFGRQDPDKTAREVVKAFYSGEATKLVVTALLFAFVFHIPGIEFMPLFAGFVPVIAVFWFALLLKN